MFGIPTIFEKNFSDILCEIIPNSSLKVVRECEKTWFVEASANSWLGDFPLFLNANSFLQLGAQMKSAISPLSISGGNSKVLSPRSTLKQEL